MPSLEHYRLVETLFQNALDHGAASLECADDLRAEVDALLASYKAWSLGIAPAPEPPLPRFGPYICDKVLGIGGMGTVYGAHRDDGQFEQPVAIKVLRGSLHSEWFRQRFLEERQILARLNHPHIARLLDGGTTAETSEPYLVMELVHGEPIDAYCDRLQLSIEARLSLMDQVLQAVEYAHRNLVVHRDLKPSNILVAANGDVKLLDFGTAKMADQKMADQKIADQQTRTTLHRPFTARYASPEQLRGQPLTTATDVFSLGVMLYELFSGKWPFGDPTSDPWRRLAADVEPLPLTWRQSASPSKSLAADLTAIVFKALDSNPAKRYGSAQELALDLQRAATGEPVFARRQSFAYRSSRFLRRNRWPVAAAALLALAIAGGVAATLVQARRAERRFSQVRSLAHFVVFDVNDGLQSLPGTTALQRATVTRSLTYLDDLLTEAGTDQPLRLEIAQAYRRLGDVLGSPFQPSLGDRPAATAAYAKGLAALAPLAKSSDVQLLDSSLRLQQGGTLTFGATQKTGLAQMRNALETLRNAVTQQPDNVELRIALAQGLTFLGSRSGAGGGTVEALTNAEVPALLRESEAHLAAAQELDPDNVDLIRALAQRESALGLVFESSQPTLSVSHYKKAVTWLDRLSPAAQNRLDVRRMRATVLYNVGFAEGQSGKASQPQAVIDLTEAVRLLQGWSTADPDDTSAAYQLTGALRSRGIVYGYQEKNQASAEDFLTAADIHRRLSEKDPLNVVYRFLRGELLTRNGNLFMSLGQTQRAHDSAAEGLKILTTLADSPKATLSHIFGACRWLTETSVVDLRAPARAAAYCRTAAQRTDQQDPDAFEGLATALDLMGDTGGAITAAEKAVALLPPPTADAPPSQQRVNMVAALRKYRAKLR